MMVYSVPQLISDLSGKKKEYAGAPQNQCVDLVNFFLAKNGKPAILNRNAIDFRTAPGYTYVPNTLSYLPPVGAVAILQIGNYGDVAIVAPGTTVNDLVLFGQNYPVGAPCRVRTHKGYQPTKGLGFLVWDGLGSNPGKSVSQIADEVIAGKWGNGTDRINRLKSAGYNPTSVQAEVNKKLRK